MRLPSLVLLCCLAAAAEPRPTLKRFNVRIPMRDGVHLSSNVYRPEDLERVPTILVRTPYGKGFDINEHYQTFVNHGYAVVVEDVRGRHDSEGVFKPLEQEGVDGYDTLNWIARQLWSDGNIGMMGGSYLGIVQWKVAVLNNPHLKAIFPVVSGDDDYRDRFYSRGGAMKIGGRLNWMADNLRLEGYVPHFSKYVLHLPLRTADVAATGQVSEMYQKAIAHPAFDSFWRAISTRERLAQVRIPVFSVGGWYDNFVESDLEAYAALSRNTGMARVLIGPWPHNMSMKFSGVDFGRGAVVPLRTLQLEWFDQWLKHKDTPLLSTPPVRVFVMGANRWREGRQWPPEGARMVAMYLASAGHANTLNGDGVLQERAPRRTLADRYVFDPADPVPTRGGAVCCNPRVFAWGPTDQRTVEQRGDVLVYTSKPLEQDTEVTGPVKVILYAATSARDTDFTAKLVDVFPDGEARNLTDGILRLRYRNSLEKEELASPGQVYRIVVDAGVTANVFLRGHRIRVEISSSNFPRFDRNPNTGRPVALETKLLKASQTIYHDRRHPSQVLLPVVE